MCSYGMNRPTRCNIAYVKDEGVLQRKVKRPYGTRSTQEEPGSLYELSSSL